MMLDMILGQLGLKKEDVEALGSRVVKGVDNIERRLERIENALGINEPLSEDEPEQIEGGFYDDAE